MKNISSWIYRHKEEPINKEISFTGNTVIVENPCGPIIVKTWTLPKVAIQAVKSAKEQDLDTFGVKTTLKNNTLLIKTECTDQKPKGSVSYQIMIPENINVKIVSEEGVKIKNLKGQAFIKTTYGPIDIQQAHNSIKAQTNSGAIKISYQNLPHNCKIIAETTSAPVHITLPASINADLLAKTEYGSVTSELPITLRPQTVQLNKKTWQKFKREAHGKIGNGGAPIRLASKNGSIKILKY